ncbi:MULTISPECIES: UDP-N-acetylglucosamine--undecaprenyl-phosphate N-acetylglucosaminephosphotransferase [Vibrio]|uniref:UDP-N-acetylglucosamine--undecaprenyl-phosphate N-acetylglucosaminephosphotransferase n=1 Tax=Vibrio TaxID=662 RepID=UPI000648DEC1|nr:MULTISPECIES: UDP-N-acetylglucosamine--undecaprenyl-phosphate N-acetylglucosaminephosphotransferase [Vibrio]NAX44262.1 UDP-N-acetylglucosamine--undecaprenyl-phosphate N-acetylglucosaminephosphotransferase [Vibrio sp. V25_P4S6T154]MBY7669195.1 UDP-N-acetylglucosamine--undecaprenyl-phosphate N-acetylglucosaminephosphotransferase [Vibrio anguillarum]OXX39899.1 undecaprenyl-phosphate alpha-N-acetylglucosaminyl 1-phosphate transferase [Vibrio sp. V17_P4S1T151]OXX61437.1 undecaprenyl-phosphate alp
MIVPFIDLGFLFFFSLISLFVLRKVAKKIGLVDKPNERKLHQGTVPLVGGIAICFCLVYFLFNNPTLIPHSQLYAASIILLVIVGALDDKYDLNFKIRIIIQAGLSIAMMMIGGIELHTIGNVFGFGEVRLGLTGYVITILAVVGAINAFNMVDGIDGLLGALSVVTFGGLGLMLTYDGQHQLAYLCLVMIVIILPYILLNIGVLGRKKKVFMGDAGSMLIGFTIIWFLLLSSQNGKTPPLRPVTALWLIAVPLMDMATIMLRRIRRGDSPFKPDREHLHHIFQRFGLNSLQTVLAISLIATCFAACGIFGEIYNISEAFMFYSFIAGFIIYASLLSYGWHIANFVLRKNNEHPRK